MARISRIVAIGYPHHIIQRGVRSMDIFKSDSDRNTYLQFIRDVLVKDRSLYGLVNDWLIYLGEEEEDDFNTIRKATRTGRPAGDNDFTIAIESRTGRVPRREKPGRKKTQRD